LVIGKQGLCEVARTGKLTASYQRLSERSVLCTLRRPRKRGKRVALANKETLVMAGN